MAAHPVSRALSATACLALALAALAAPAAFAQRTSITNEPAATLLFPYFEVDLTRPDGRTTLISINNAGSEATSARVVMWTNMGRATLVFDVVLDADEARTLDLRQFFAGNIPLPDAEPMIEGCPYSPDFGWTEAEIADLISQHAGVADSSGQCYGALAEPGLAVGYVTVDATNRCLEGFVYPGNPFNGPTEYFEQGGLGLASNDNVLWGDIIFYEPEGDAARAMPAVSVVADAEAYSGLTPTFYGEGDDNRATLPSAYRARFLAGEPLGTESSFLVWLDPKALNESPNQGFTCDEPPVENNFCHYLDISVANEAGESAAKPLRIETPRVTQAMHVGSDIPTTAGSGVVTFSNEELVACMLIPIGPEPEQAVVVPILRADGRFSVASGAVAIAPPFSAP